MSNRQRWVETRTEMAVGMMVLAVAALLLTLTVTLSRHYIFTRTYPLEVTFANAMGLREGDGIFCRGITVGRISEIFVEGEVVVVRAALKEPLSIRDDYRIDILSKSLLGGRYLNIYEGTPGRPRVEVIARLKGAEPTDLVDEATSAIRSVRKTLEEGLLDNVQQVIANLRHVSEQMTKGEGTLGKLMVDDALFVDLKTAAADLRNISGKLSAGEGSLGKLLVDDTVYNDLKQITTNLRDVSQRITDGQGALGMLLSEDASLYTNLNATVASVRRLAESVERGEGSVGKLLRDEALYKEIRGLINEARTAIDDLREYLPLTSFGSLMLGAF